MILAKDLERQPMLLFSELRRLELIWSPKQIFDSSGFQKKKKKKKTIARSVFIPRKYRVAYRSSEMEKPLGPEFEGVIRSIP
jgi:hypothetical protein